MRKMMLLAALMAMLVVAAIPAIAQVEQGFDQETESGDVSQTFEISGGGDNGSSCVNVNGNVNTGNLQTQSGSIQYASDTEDFEQEDLSNALDVGGTSTVTCDQQVNQAASAG